MPKEYIYKIVLDDAEVDRVLTSIDTRIEALTKKADASFQNVGRNMGTGLKQAVTETQAASRQIQQTEKQTAQQVQQHQRQAASGAKKTSQQRVQAARAAGQAEVQSAQQATTARKAEIKVIDEQIAGIEKLKAVSEQRVQLARSRAEATEAVAWGASERTGAALIEEDAARLSGDPERMRVAGAGVKSAVEQEQVAFEGLQDKTTDLDVEEKHLSALNSQLEGVRAQREALIGTTQEQQAAEQSLGETSRQQSQAAIQGLQAESTQAKQLVDQRKAAVADAKDAVTAAKAGQDQAKQAQSEQKKIWNESKEAVKSAKAAEKQAILDVKAVQKEGSDAAKATAEQAKTDATAQVEAANDRAAAEKKAFDETVNAADEAGEKVSEATRARETAQNKLTRANTAQTKATDRLRKSKNQLAKTDRAAAKRARTAQRDFVSTTKTYTKQRSELNKLAKKHGEFNVTIGKSADEMNDLEKEVDGVIKSNKQLADSIDNIVAKQGKFNVAVGRGTFAGGPGRGPSGTQFRQAGFAAQRVGIPGMAAMGEAAAVAGPIGIAIAGTLLAVKALTQALMAMAKAAFQAFQALVKGAVEAAKEIEVAEAQFTAFFEGDTKAAEASLQKLRDLSVELGQNVVGVGRAFLPEVESLDQLEQVVKVATALARFQPEQGALGARISLQEALGGEFRSLQRRFEISPVAIDKIRAAFETTGVTGLLTELQAELERTGRSVEDLSNTFGVSSGIIRERLRQIQAEMGEPIIDELKEQFKGIDDELEELEPDLKTISKGFGEVLAMLAEIVGTEVENFLESFDPEPLYAVMDALFGVADAFGIMIFGFNAGEGAAQGFEDGLFGLAGLLLKVEGYFLAVALAIAETRVKLQEILPLLVIMNDASEFTLRFGVNFPGHEAMAELVSILADAEEGFISTGSSIEEVIAKIAEHDEKVANLSSSLREYLESLKDSNKEGENAADTFLSMGDALARLQSIQEEYAETQKKINEAIKEFDIAATLRFEKMLTDASRKRMQAEIDNAQKLIDIERKNKEKIADIRTTFDSNIVKAAVNLGDKEEDIARKHGDAVLDLEDNLNDERISAEEKYQEELRRLRDKFNFDAFEAMLANDGKALRQIRRRQSFEEDQLKKNRDNEKDDIAAKGNDRRAELDKQLQRELRDARIANARKIRDLDAALTEQLAKQELARKREVEAAAIAERRKTAVLNEQLDQSLQDYQTWWDERHRTTVEKSADDLKALQTYVDEAMDLMAQLSNQGIVFDPFTGRPERIFTQPSIDPDDTSTEAIEAIRERVVELMAASEFLISGEPRDRDIIREDVAALSVEELVDELDQLQAKLAIFEVEPQRFVDTQNLAQQLLVAQAVKLGGQVGLSAKEIVNETLGLSMEELSGWIDSFINKYTIEELPDFSIFGESATGIPGIPGGMSVVTPGTPGAPFFIPAGPMSSEAGPTSGIPGAGIFAPGSVPAAQGQQPIFTFPNVTDAAFATQTAAPGMTYPAFGTGLGGVPSFGEAVSAFPNYVTGMFGAGTAMPQNPAAGFDIEAFNTMLQGQIDSQIAAEMVKRGEIEETLDLAVLLAEQEALAINTVLGGEVQAFQAASEAEIAILEQTIAKQQETLSVLREDPTLANEAATVEASLVILNDTLTRKREELAVLTQAILDQETAATIVAEEDKQDAIDSTVSVVEQAALSKKKIVLAGADEETTAAQMAAEEQAGIIREQEIEIGEIKSDGRQTELEAEAEHREERADLTENAFEEAVDIADDFWIDWLRENNLGMEADYRQLYEWIRQRNQILATITPIIPGMGILPGDDDPPDSGGGTTVSEAELENMAMSFANDLGILTPLMRGDIIDMGYQELVDFVTWLQEQLGQRYMGGGFGPGPILVGERGPEIVDMSGAGRVIPNNSPLFRNMIAGEGGRSSVTFHNTMEVTNQFPDPRGIPPTYLKAMENIAVKVAKRTWAGK